MDFSSIGKNIRTCRDDHNIKQEKLAELVDVSASYMGAIERGEKLPSLDVFIRIANALEANSDILLFGVLNTQNEIISSKLEKEIDNLPYCEQRRILNVVNTMVNDLK